MAFKGDLEIHLTVAECDANGNEGLRNRARSDGWKYLHIVLARGATPSQPMLTRHIQGDLKSAIQETDKTTQILLRDGFKVTRVKIEAAPWNDDVPEDDDVAQSESRHFEHHIKLLLPPDVDPTPLARVASRHDAHLSRNALKQRSDNFTERFVTQRCFGVGRIAARSRFSALLADLISLGYPILDTEEEYVIYDSNLSLDDGWLSTNNRQTRPDIRTNSCKRCR